MSKATKRHCAGTVQSQGGRVTNVKQVSFEPGPEDSYGRCGSDKIRQTSTYNKMFSTAALLQLSDWCRLVKYCRVIGPV